MFVDFYGLSSLPFQLAPDSRFFYGSKSHKRALAHLTYGLAQGDGFIVVTGEIGAGKTTLIGHLMSKLDRTAYVAAKIATTQLTPVGFLRMVLSAFDLPYKGTDKAKMLRQFEQFFHANHAEGKRTLLIVDEVQNLPFTTLEELRMLSNLAVGTQAVLQTCLLGQPQFRDIIASARAEQLRQRVFTAYHLGALDEAEVAAYIEHRLKVASWSGDPSFDDEAIRAIYRHTGGIPRRINSLCSRVLLLGFLNECHRISLNDVEEIAEEWRAEWKAGNPAHATPGNACSPLAVNGSSTATRLDEIERQLQEQGRLLRRTLDLAEKLVNVGA